MKFVSSNLTAYVYKKYFGTYPIYGRVYSYVDVQTWGSQH